METDNRLLPDAPVSGRSLPRSPDLTRWLLPGLLVLAAVVRVYWGLRPRIVWGDEPFYLWLGQSLLNGEGYQFFGISGVHFSPLYPLLAGFIARLVGPGGDWSQALAAGSVVLYVTCGALFVLPIHDIARRIGGRGAGLCAGLVAALYPALTVSVPLWGTMTEPLYLLLIATAWWALLVVQQERRLWAYAAAGAALALAYLTRNEAIVYLIAGLGAVLLIEIVAPAPRAALPVRENLKPDGHAGRGASAQPPHRMAHEAAPPGIEPPGSLTPPPAEAPIPERQGAISRTAGVKRALIGAVLAIGVFGIVISPYLIALHEQTGKWQLLEEAGSTYVSAQGLARNDLAAFDRATWGLDPASGEVYLFSPTSEGQGLLAAISADPRGFLRLLRSNLADLLTTTFSSQLIPLVCAGLVVLGLFARPWNTHRLRAELLLIASLAGPLSFLPFFIQPRYLAGVLIPALVWIGGGTAWLGEWLARTWAQIRAERPLRVSGGAVAREQRGRGEEGYAGYRSQSLLRALPVLLLALLMLWQAPRLWEQQQTGGGFRQAHRAAADALVAVGVTQDELVLSRFPAIAFHAGVRWAPTPAASWPEVAAYARRKGATFLALDALEARLRPQLAFLLDPAQAPADLEYLNAVDDGTGPVLIYRFR